jgi:hypothetical protein
MQARQHPDRAPCPCGAWARSTRLGRCFCLSCAKVQTPQNATWVQAERRRRAVGRAAWMPRERRKDMDVRSARAHGASPEGGYSDEGGTQPGARTLGYLVSFQVTRRRRNRSGVSQSRISRAAITWRIQISSCTEPCRSCASPSRGRTIGVGQATHLQLTHRFAAVVTSGVSHRDRVTPNTEWLLILLLSARQIRRHKSRLGCRLNAGGVEWAERHGCRESRPPPWMADGGGPTERRRSEGIPTKEEPNQEPGPLVTWGWCGIPIFK